MVTGVDDLILEKTEVKLVHIMVSGHLFLGIHPSRSKFDILINTMTSCFKNKNLFFFFYINNLLHGVHRQVMVATFETTYKNIKLHKVKGKKREKKEKEKRK